MDGKSALSIHEKENQTTRLAKKMSRWEVQERQFNRHAVPSDHAEETALLKRRKTKHRPKLSLEEW